MDDRKYNGIPAWAQWAGVLALSGLLAGVICCPECAPERIGLEKAPTAIAIGVLICVMLISALVFRKNKS